MFGVWAVVNCSYFNSGFTDNLKISLCAETKGWKVALGRQMNEMYRQRMQDTLDQIEDLSKRLSRPIKDLDDIRVTMAAQKELREDEITIDLSLGPIEVSTARAMTVLTG